MRPLALGCLTTLVLLLAACDGSGSEEPDFGFEEGYFYWFEVGERVVFLRDRNHLSIRFHESFGQAYHDSVLQAHGIETLWSQTFGKEVPMPGRYRVTRDPAEAYYTRYGEAADEAALWGQLGNLPGVEYVLPAFYLSEEFWDLRMTPVILYSFEADLAEERQPEILDSLTAADGTALQQLFPGEPWSPFHFYVPETARTDPYTLYHHYATLPFFESVSLDMAQTARFLRPSVTQPERSP